MRIHCHVDKVGLIINVAKEWPASRTWLKDERGSHYKTVHEAVRAIVEAPTYPYVPMGCQTPKEDGSCPGHSDEEEGGAEALVVPRPVKVETRWEIP